MAIQPTVLVVEQDKLIRESIALRLCRAGYSVSELCHPRQALAATTARCYDVAVLANELPELDGISLMQRLKSRGGIRQCVIVAGDRSGSNSTAAIERGAFAVLNWSSVPSDLVNTVERAYDETCSQPLLDEESKQRVDSGITAHQL